MLTAALSPEPSCCCTNTCFAVGFAGWDHPIALGAVQVRTHSLLERLPPIDPATKRRPVGAAFNLSSMVLHVLPPGEGVVNKKVGQRVARRGAWTTGRACAMGYTGVCWVDTTCFHMLVLRCLSVIAHQLGSLFEESPSVRLHLHLCSPSGMLASPSQVDMRVDVAPAPVTHLVSFR